MIEPRVSARILRLIIGLLSKNWDEWVIFHSVKDNLLWGLAPTLWGNSSLSLLCIANRKSHFVKLPILLFYKNLHRNFIFDCRWLDIIFTDYTPHFITFSIFMSWITKNENSVFKNCKKLDFLLLIQKWCWSSYGKQKHRGRWCRIKFQLCQQRAMGHTACA